MVLTNRCDFIDDVEFLGFNHIKTRYDVYAALAPLLGKILKLLTLSFTKPYYGVMLYAHHPKSYNQELIKLLIDTIAISGIIANAAKYGATHSMDVGFVKGSL